jgi:pimeloyl-ACP methyl ester carboxylesterase
MLSPSFDWTFAGTWPYSPRFFETDGQRLHFIDEGPRDGRPVVLVHGNPSWGYLFRHFIEPLVKAGHRVIVPDHLGHGRSDKPPESAVYGIERHGERLEALLDSLELQQVTLVVHDWGAPIGFYWATRHPERVASLVILNSFLHRPTEPVRMPLPLRLFRLGGVGEMMVKGLHGIVRGFLLGAGVTDHARLTAEVRRAYLSVNPTFASRTGILAFARQFPAGPTGDVAVLLGGIHERLRTLAERPTLMLWAEKDSVFGPNALARWRADFPRAELIAFPESGHFLQEDAHELAVPALMRFLAQHAVPALRASGPGGAEER